MNPVQQFVMFTTSNGTLSFTMLVLTIYLLEKFVHTKNVYLVCLVIGILFLANRSFIVSVITFLLLRLLIKKINFRNLIESFCGFLIFWIPIYIYRSFIKLNGYEVADTNIVDYGQFIWISKYLNKGVSYWVSKFILSKENFELRLKTNWDSTDEWYCQSIPENFICFVEDIRLSSIYLFLPLILLFLSIVFLKTLDKPLYEYFITTSLVTIFFWSFIGWYPPLRFSLYSYGNVVMLFLIFYFSSLKKLDTKISFSLTLFFGLLNISHWNNPNLLEITYFDYLSFVFLTLYLYFQVVHYKKLQNE